MKRRICTRRDCQVEGTAKEEQVEQDTSKWVCGKGGGGPLDSDDTPGRRAEDGVGVALSRVRADVSHQIGRTELSVGNCRWRCPSSKHLGILTLRVHSPLQPAAVLSLGEHQGLLGHDKFDAALIVAYFLVCPKRERENQRKMLVGWDHPILRRRLPKLHPASRSENSRGGLRQGHKIGSERKRLRCKRRNE